VQRHHRTDDIYRQLTVHVRRYLTMMK